MAKDPKVSIFIPVYNTEKYIAQAIESILDQTFKDLELVIVDDCSSDETPIICAAYSQKDFRIKFFQNPENLGMMPNWNHGLTLCRGQYWGKLDADDWWEPDFIERCVEALEQHEEVGMVCSGFDEIDENDQLLRRTVDPSQEGIIDLKLRVLEGPTRMFAHVFARQGIGLLRYELFKQLGPFTLLDGGDTEMWYRIGCHHKLYYVAEVMHHHRIWSANFTRQQVIKQGKSELNLFETRNAIFDYYKSQGALSRGRHRKMYKHNEIEYNKYLFNAARKNGRAGEAAKIFLRSLRLNPLKTVWFYLTRLMTGRTEETND